MVVINYRAPGAVSSRDYIIWRARNYRFRGRKRLSLPEVDIWRHSQYGLNLHNEPLVVPTTRLALVLAHVMCSNLLSVADYQSFAPLNRT